MIARRPTLATSLTERITNSDFDYLRDNMRYAARDDDRYPKHMQQSQGRLNYAIIDEVDNILIDEARTPLIISGPAHDNIRKYADADRVARQLKANDHFEVNEKDHNVTLTDEGVRAAEKLAGVESFYTAGNMEWPHLIDNSLKAHYLYKRDVNYVVKDGGVVIVDEFTGRLMEGRQWSDGLHQAVEAKEGVKIKEETQTLATITLQNFFKLYGKLSGMTGTAMTEAGEFWKIYELDVIAIPTNRVLQRKEFPDLIYCSENEKIRRDRRGHRAKEQMGCPRSIKMATEEWGTILSENGEIESLSSPKVPRKKIKIRESDYESVNRTQRSTRSWSVRRRSRRASSFRHCLDRRGINHDVLNAKHHKPGIRDCCPSRPKVCRDHRDQHGRSWYGHRVWAGIRKRWLGPFLQDKYPTRLDVPREEWDELVDGARQRARHVGAGRAPQGAWRPLHVVGTERHEARRIDLQLRGRCGRQGDPGSSRFYLSLEDDLMRIFAGPWVEKVFRTLGMTEGEAIESKAVTRRIEGAQKKVEERNFEIRKNLLEYDEVMDEQRKRVYTYRQNILGRRELQGTDALEMIDQQVELQHLLHSWTPTMGATRLCSWVSSSSCRLNFEPRDFRGMDFDEASTATRWIKPNGWPKRRSMMRSKRTFRLEEEERDWSLVGTGEVCQHTLGAQPPRSRPEKDWTRPEVAEVSRWKRLTKRSKKIDLSATARHFPEQG